MKLFANLLKPFKARPSSRRNATREKLVVFTRYPEPGKTKTRLIPSLGSEGAAELHRRMTEHTLARVRKLQKLRLLSVEVRHEGGDKSLMQEWLGPGLSYFPQGSGGLGERMARAFRDAFRAGMERVVVVGTDCPDVTENLLLEALEILGHTDVVVGPARDGGYYLIGLRQAIPELFLDMPWGTEKVLERTRQAANSLGISVQLLELLDDVDRPEDLPVWERLSRQKVGSSRALSISIIIPTLNEAENIAGTLASARGPSDVEVIVVDGGSRDKTVEVARSCGAKVILSPRGRAKQMNAGAAVAAGEVLLFLHGDTRLPRGFDHHVHQTLGRPSTVAGAFQLHTDGHFAGLRIMERLVNLRSRRLQLPYGDQAIFLRADLFWEMGGFPNMPIMEDFEMVRRLRRRGRIVTAPVPILTSARRWKKIGILRATLINYAIPLAYHLGVSPSRLARWYHHRAFKLFKSFDSFDG